MKDAKGFSTKTLPSLFARYGSARSLFIEFLLEKGKVVFKKSCVLYERSSDSLSREEVVDIDSVYETSPFFSPSIQKIVICFYF